jgi:hypothetical protein
LKQFILFIFIGFAAQKASSQTIDSLFFNLYTDSLKKGTYNYINVDAKYSNGLYLPLGVSEVDYTATAGKFERSSLFIPFDIKEESVTITVTLKANKALTRSVTLFIKKKLDDEPLKTSDEILNGTKTKTPTSTKKSRRRRG